MGKNRRITPLAARLACALALATAPAGFAAAQAEIPDAAREFVDYLADFDARYPDPSKIDMEAVLEAEGERIALLYCRAIGFDGPCAPSERDSDTGFAPAGFATADARVGASASPWWWWIFNFISSVGVIPNTWNCGPYAPVELFMDDASPPTANSWIGATGIGANTVWRLCKVNLPQSWQFQKLSATPNLSLDYAVQRLGVFCPPGSVAVWRHQANVPGNTNASTGPIFPNLRVPNVGWYTWTCNFDTSVPGGPLMTSFPTLSIPAYGLYASRGLRPPAFPSVFNGLVQQRDFAVSWWAWGPANPTNWVMQGSSTHTLRFLARVQ